jgi:hypothetical protein
MGILPQGDTRTGSLSVEAHPQSQARAPNRHPMECQFREPINSIVATDSHRWQMRRFCSNTC